MTNSRRIGYVALLLGVALTGCFTGVESTPRISDSEVKRQKITTGAEELMFSTVADEPPAQWKPGKRLYVTDSKVSLIFTPASTGVDSLQGHELIFLGFVPTENITGTGATDVHFTSDRGDDLHYVVDADPITLFERAKLIVPFTVEGEAVRLADSLLRGNTYYIKTPTWHRMADGVAFNALRHVPVKVDSVTAGTAVYPLAVNFTTADSLPGLPRSAKVFITYGTDKAASRNFPTVFAFDNPRKQYPDIKDDTWDMIIHSRLKQGMSRDECRLALGAPAIVEQIPTTAGMVERWRYDDGVFLLFEDGYLAKFRQ